MQTTIPFAKQYGKKMHTAGKYKKGHPEGLIVHFTAGRRDLSGFDYGFGQGYTYLYIDFDGTLYQAHDLSEWGYHAGVSSWPGISGVTETCIGVEIACAGKLTPIGNGKFKSWYGEIFDESQVRIVNGKDNVQAGTYCVYSKAQEDTLKKLCLWLKANAPDIFTLDWVLGHDEVAPKRKNDPGGSLSVTMPEFRNLLNNNVPELPWEMPASNPHDWKPDVFFKKMDEYMVTPTEIKYKDLQDIWPKAKIKIQNLLK